MNKEEILAKSRKENKNQDIFELEIVNKGSNIAMRIGLLICCLISLVSAIFIANNNYWILAAMPCWAIYFSMLGTLFIYKFYCRHKRHELIFSIIYISVCILMLVRFMLYILGVWC